MLDSIYTRTSKKAPTHSTLNYYSMFNLFNTDLFMEIQRIRESTEVLDRYAISTRLFITLYFIPLHFNGGAR